MGGTPGTTAPVSVPSCQFEFHSWVRCYTDDGASHRADQSGTGDASGHPALKVSPQARDRNIAAGNAYLDCMVARLATGNYFRFRQDLLSGRPTFNATFTALAVRVACEDKSRALVRACIGLYTNDLAARAQDCDRALQYNTEQLAVSAWQNRNDLARWATR